MKKYSDTHFFSTMNCAGLYIWQHRIPQQPIKYVIIPFTDGRQSWRGRRLSQWNRLVGEPLWGRDA